MSRFSRLETNPSPEARPAGAPAADIQQGLHYPSGDDSTERLDLDAANCVRQGHQLLYRNDFKRALRWYSRAIDKESTLLEPWLAVIRTLLLKGDLTEAYTWIGRGLTVFPNAPGLLALRSVQYARRGMLRQAMNNSDAVLEQNAADPQAHVARGEVLLLAENKNADYCFEQALQVARAGEFHVPMIIGMIHEERRMWAKAIAYYARAAECDERNPALWYHVGSCRAELGQRPQAEKAFEMAAECCAPDDPFRIQISHAAPGGLWRRVKNLFRRK